MPKFLRMRIKLTDPKDWTDKVKDALVEAISIYNEIVYGRALSNAPIDRSPPDPRKPRNLIRTYLKPMEGRAFGRPYFTFGIPNVSSGSDAERAFLAIMSLEFGWLTPRFIVPRRKQFLTFPVEKVRIPGMARPGPGGLPGEWLVLPQVYQPKYKKNPFISRAFQETEDILPTILYSKLKRKVDLIKELEFYVR